MASKHRIGALLCGTALLLSWPPVSAQSPKVTIDSHSIGGAVTGAKGPEAGVWVIAETTDLPTKYT